MPQLQHRWQQVQLGPGPPPGDGAGLYLARERAGFRDWNPGALGRSERSSARPSPENSPSHGCQVPPGAARLDSASAGVARPRVAGAEYSEGATELFYLQVSTTPRPGSTLWRPGRRGTWCSWIQVRSWQPPRGCGWGADRVARPQVQTQPRRPLRGSLERPRQRSEVCTGTRASPLCFASWLPGELPAGSEALRVSAEQELPGEDVVAKTGTWRGDELWGWGRVPPLLFFPGGVPGRQVSGGCRQAAAAERGRSHVGLAPLLRKGRVLTGGCHLESDRRGSPGALGRKPPIRRWMTLRGPAASALQLGSALELGSAEAIWAKLRGGDCRSSTQASCPARPSCGSPELSEDTSWATPMSKPQSLLTLSGPLCRFPDPFLPLQLLFK